MDNEMPISNPNLPANHQDIDDIREEPEVVLTKTSKAYYTMKLKQPKYFKGTEKNAKRK